MRLEVRARERRGEQDARLALGVIEVDRDDELGARERLRRRERRAAPAGERVAPLPAGAPAPDAVGIGEGEQQARSLRHRRPAPGAAAPRPPGAAGRARRGGRARARSDRPRRRPHPASSSSRERMSASRAPAPPRQQVALGQERGQLRRERHEPERAGLEQQVRQARVQRQARHLAPVRADAPLPIERPQACEQVARARQLRRRRRVEPAQRRRVPRAPAGELQRERRQIRIEDLRRRVGGERGVRTLAPGAVAHPGLRAAGAPLALLGGRARDALGLQAPHAGGRIEARAPRQARVDHDGHALDGEAGLGDVGREHDLAHAGGGGCERGALRLGPQVPEERQHARRAARRLLLRAPPPRAGSRVHRGGRPARRRGTRAARAGSAA